MVDSTAAISGTPTTLATDENGQVTIKNFTKDTLLYVQYPDHWVKKVTVKDNSPLEVNLEKVTVSDTGDNKFSVASFNKPEDYAAGSSSEDNYTRTLLTKDYTAGIFTFKAINANLYINKTDSAIQSSGNITATESADGTVSGDNNKKYTITENPNGGSKFIINPTKDGIVTLNIRPAGSIIKYSGDEKYAGTTSRGYKINGEATYFNESSSSFKAVKIPVSANETTTIEILGANMSNVESLTFEGEKTVAEQIKAAAAIGNDRFTVASGGNVYVVHALTDEELSGDHLLLKKDGVTRIDVTEVYSSIKFSEGDVLKASDLNAKALYAFIASNASVPESASDIKYTWETSVDE